MTKSLGVLTLVAALMIALPVCAGDKEDERPRGFLSFSFDPAKFFQAGPTEVPEETQEQVPQDLEPGDEAPEEQVLETEPGAEPGTEKEKEEVKDARVFISFALYGLFRYDATEGIPDTFKMPGAYVKGEGEWENYKISIMTNAAIANSLTWAYVDLAPWERHKDRLRLRLGVFAVPFGMQAQTFPFDLSSIVYSLVVQDVTEVAGIYDMGAMAHGRFKVQDGGLNYALAVLNGEFASSTDTNEAKTFAGRLGFEFTPFLEVGASYYRGSTTDIIYDYDIQYERMGIDVKWSPDKFKIRGEFISAVEDPEPHYVGLPPVFDRGVSARTGGWWVDAGVFAWINEKLTEKINDKSGKDEKKDRKYEKYGLELYAHCQGFNPPPDEAMRLVTGHASRPQFVYGLGVNLDLSENVKLQALWQHLDLGSYHLGKYAGYDPKKRDDRVLVQLAVAVF